MTQRTCQLPGQLKARFVCYSHGLEMPKLYDRYFGTFHLRAESSGVSFQQVLRGSATSTALAYTRGLWRVAWVLRQFRRGALVGGSAWSPSTRRSRVAPIFSR